MQRLHTKDEQALAAGRLEGSVAGLDDHAIVIAADPQPRQRLVDLGQLDAQGIQAAADLLQRQAGGQEFARHLKADKVAKAVPSPALDPDRRLQEPGLRPVPQPAFGHLEQPRDVADRVRGGGRAVVAKGVRVGAFRAGAFRASARVAARQSRRSDVQGGGLFGVPAAHGVPVWRAAWGDNMASPSMNTWVPSARAW